MKLGGIAILLLATHAWAQEPPPGEPKQEPPKQEPPKPEPPPTEPASSPIEARLEALEDANEDLRDEIDQLKDDQKYLEDRVSALQKVSGRVTGYLDVGFFTVTGDGAGIRSDIGFEHFPEYASSGVPDSWVFMGDPLSTMINSRGDPATTGESRAITLDSIRGRTSTFLVNTMNVGLFAELGKRAVFTSKIDFLPRSRDVSDPNGVALGDYVDVRLAYVEYRFPTDDVSTSIFVGKFDSVLGFEYRSQEAPSRIEVTPSLICRYTCGYPIGLKGRFGFFKDVLVLNAAVTNGSHGTEGFPFYDETDANEFKTVAGRLSVRLPIKELELGVSGQYGAQDNQDDLGVRHWLYGADVHFHRHDLVIRGEYVQGRAKGKAEPGDPRCRLSPCLEFKGAYGLVGYRVTNEVMPYVRVDWRDALHESGASFIYISKLWRGTGGFRFAIDEHLILKAEYTVNRELGRIPQFKNDVFTTSMVVTF